MNVEFYDSKKRKKLLADLNEQFGVYEIPRILFETGKEKIRGFSGDLTIDELYSLDRLANIEFMGMYLMKYEFSHLRLGFDCALLLKNQLSKNVVVLDDKQTDSWMNGKSLELGLSKGMYVVGNGIDTFGCGFSDDHILINFVPKERRIRRN